MKNVILSYLLLIIVAGHCRGQALILPLDLAKQIFDSSRFKDIKKYSTGEYEGHPDGRELNKSAIKTFMLLAETERTAVVAMSLTDTAGRGIDTYLHFVKEDGIWKMEAFRALAMTGMIEQIKIEMENMTAAEIDTAIARGQRDTSDHYGIKSREDFDYELGNSRLTLALDKDLIAHFNQHKTEFEKLKNIAKQILLADSSKDMSRIQADKDFDNDLRRLFISSVRPSGYDRGEHGLDFLIGGVIDNTVGYLYLQDIKNLPAMNPKNLIMLRAIGDGWYIYKTT